MSLNVLYSATYAISTLITTGQVNRSNLLFPKTLTYEGKAHTVLYLQRGLCGIESRTIKSALLHHQKWVPEINFTVAFLCNSRTQQRMRFKNGFLNSFKALVVEIVSLDPLPLTYPRLGRWIDDGFATCRSSHGPHKRQRLVFS